MTMASAVKQASVVVGGFVTLWKALSLHFTLFCRFLPSKCHKPTCDQVKIAIKPSEPCFEWQLFAAVLVAAMEPLHRLPAPARKQRKMLTINITYQQLFNELLRWKKEAWGGCGAILYLVFWLLQSTGIRLRERRRHTTSREVSPVYETIYQIIAWCKSW